MVIWDLAVLVGEEGILDLAVPQPTGLLDLAVLIATIVHFLVKQVDMDLVLVVTVQVQIDLGQVDQIVPVVLGTLVQVVLAVLETLVRVALAVLGILVQVALAGLVTGNSDFIEVSLSFIYNAN